MSSASPFDIWKVLWKFWQTWRLVRPPLNAHLISKQMLMAEEIADNRISAARSETAEQKYQRSELVRREGGRAAAGHHPRPRVRRPGWWLAKLLPESLTLIYGTGQKAWLLWINVDVNHGEIHRFFLWNVYSKSSYPKSDVLKGTALFNLTMRGTSDISSFSFRLAIQVLS